MDKTKTKDWICFLNENNQQQQMFVEIINFDASFVKFKTDMGNVVMIPTCRILKVKEGEVRG